MDHRKFDWHNDDREARLRKAWAKVDTWEKKNRRKKRLLKKFREWLRLRKTQEVEPPMGAVIPTLSADGDCVCPKCEQFCFTPVKRSPTTGKMVKYVLKPKACVPCPHCGTIHYLTAELAAKHQEFHYGGKK